MCVSLPAVLPVHYQFKGKDTATGFNRSQLMQLTIAALPRGSNVMWCVIWRLASQPQCTQQAVLAAAAERRQPQQQVSCAWMVLF
jgi:GAF domain-containing protein